MTLFRSLILTLILSVTGAAVGAWGAAEYVLHRMARPTPLHELVHDKLHLSDSQRRLIEGIEKDHSARQKALEAEMRAANADLAQALQEHHAYSPHVQAAIDRFHAAMGALQKETIIHVLAMRAVLTSAQAAKFDETVVKSLNSDPM